MTYPPGVPSLGEIALRYGTINRQQMDRLLKMQGKAGPSFAALMHQEKMANPYQISLLQLIHEFLVLKQQGEKFGRIAVKKGFATRHQVDGALKRQLNEFKREKHRRMIGDILVESGVITAEQRQIIASEQRQIEREHPVSVQAGDDLGQLILTDEERGFLVIRNRDKTFAAAVIKKKFATRHQVDRAMETQMKMFKRHRKVTLLGDLMVAEGVLTPEQRNHILAEQKKTDGAKQQPALLEPAEETITVTISLDAMEAWAEISDPKPSPASLVMLKTAMGSKGIIHGILRDEILQCCLDKGLPRFILARGDLPEVPGEARVRYLFDTRSEPARVERGDPLAVVEKIATPTPGTDILGNTINTVPAPPKAPPVFNCGKGARVARDQTRAFAGKSGTPFLSVLARLHVFPPVNVLDDADMKFGAIETYAALSVSGTLTGAYPVTAGTVKAREIRDTRLESLGDITVSIGITNAVIKTQGSVRARYIHNSTIEAFGDVIVDHEILDSTITISGRCLALKSRIIASTVSARGGVTALGVGSDVTESCRISAACEQHLVTELERVAVEIASAGQALRTLENNIKDLEGSIDRVFEKMVRLKRLYDTATAEKTRYRTESVKETPRTAALVAALDKKLAAAFNALKNLNRRKTTMTQALEKLKTNKTAVRQKTDARVQTLEQKRVRLLDWGQKTQGLAEITVTGPMAQATRVSGPFSSTIVKEPCRGVTIVETRKHETIEEFELAFKKINPAPNLVLI